MKCGAAVGEFGAQNIKQGLETFGLFLSVLELISGVPRRRGFKPPPPPKKKILSFAKAELNSQFRGIYIRNYLIRIWDSFL
jgi:hypothetical protein